LKLARQDKRLAEIVNDDGEILAQVVYAIKNEMAVTLKDILFRRTGIGTLGNPGEAVLEKVADIAANELGWSADRKKKELIEVKKVFKLPD
jgi:glycerol-3-phosphate dehydrogenase